MIEQQPEFHQGQTDGSIDGTPRATAVPETETYHHVLSEFSHLAQFPPGKDPYMGACYGAVVDLLGQGQELHGLVTDTLSQRDITPKHFVNLFYRGVQHVELFKRNNADYPFAYQSREAWQDELTDLLAHDGAALKEVLLHKSTTSTIYQRYAGSHAVLSALFPQQSLTIADFGCGGNYGLRGMEIREPFKPFVDQTENDLVKQLTTQQVNITEGVAIDWQNPYDPDVAAWRLACSFYPQELQALPDVIALESRLAEANHVRFLEGNLLALPVGTPDLPIHGFDAVVMNTVCYQMPQAQERLVQTAQTLLKPEGLFIIQDFAQKDPANPTRLNFSVNWHQQPFSYRTFIVGPATNGEMKELLQWEDGRCKAVRPGEDFSLLQDAA